MSLKHLTTGSTNPPLENGKIRLYSMRFCPFAHRVHLVLAAKKVPHDVVFINLRNKPDWFLKKNPLGLVPTIVVDGEDLFESLIISDFLDEKFSIRPLHSKDPIKKAKDRLLIDKFSKVISSFYNSVLSAVIDSQAIEQLYLGLEIFEKELIKRGTLFYGGGEPGMVDYMLWPWYERMEMVQIVTSNKFTFSKERFMHLFEWSKAMIQDEAVKSYFLTTNVYVKYIKEYKSGRTLDYDNII